MQPWHIYPTNDIKDHEVEKGSMCPCLPTVIILPDGEILISHQSFDGREWRETTNPRLN